MNFGQAVNSYLRKYATFRGRASRAEYWYAYLFCSILILLAAIFDISLIAKFFTLHSAEEAPSLFVSLVTLALFFPSIAISVRRLHDTERSGWWLLLILVPIVGTIALIVFFCQRGTEGTNRFGYDPVATWQAINTQPA